MPCLAETDNVHTLIVMKSKMKQILWHLPRNNAISVSVRMRHFFLLCDAKRIKGFSEMLSAQTAHRKNEQIVAFLNWITGIKVNWSQTFSLLLNPLACSGQMTTKKQQARSCQGNGQKCDGDVNCFCYVYSKRYINYMRAVVCNNCVFILSLGFMAKRRRVKKKNETERQ